MDHRTVLGMREPPEIPLDYGDSTNRLGVVAPPQLCLAWGSAAHISDAVSKPTTYDRLEKCYQKGLENFALHLHQMHSLGGWEGPLDYSSCSKLERCNWRSCTILADEIV